MIKFSINKTFFLHALNATKRAISTKNAISILSTIKIEVHSQGILLTGSNGQISIEYHIPITEENSGLLITSPGSILLEANFFINVISSMPSLNIDFEETDQEQVILTSGKSEITLKGKHVDNYPRIQEMEQSTPLTIKTKVLKSIIAETAFAASTQETRPILTGVHMTLTEDLNLKAVATDSHRMSQRILTLDQATTSFDVVIPSRSLKELSAVFSDDVEDLEIFFSNSQILFKSETISFYTRLLEGAYPDTNRLLMNSFETEVVFKTQELRQAMERAFLVSNAAKNGTVKLEIENGTVVAHVNSPEVGKVNEELEVQAVSGENLTISFNPTYLIDALKAFKSEAVIIRFVSPVRPFTLTPEDNSENFIQLITPVRTN